MNNQGIKRLGLAALVALGLPACADLPTATPEPGILAVSWISPFDDDGGVLLRVSGSVTPQAGANPDLMFFASAEETTGAYRVAVLGGRIANGPLFTMDVADIHQTGEYRVELLEVSDTGNRLRNDLARYTLVIGPTK